MSLQHHQGNSITADSPPPKSSPLRHILQSALIDAGGAYLVYVLAEPHVGQKLAIVLSAAPSLLNNVVTYALRRTLDYVGVMVIAGTIAGLLIYLLGGSPRLLLARDSVITGVIGLVFLGSLALRRPLAFYLARQTVTGDDPQRMAAWDAHYAASPTRMGMPRVTLVWGLGLLLEAAARVVLAFTLPIPLFLAIWPIISIAIYFGLMAWSFSYGHALRRREENAPAPPVAQTDEAVPRS